MFGEMIKRSPKSLTSPHALKQTLKHLEDAIGDWERLVSTPPGSPNTAAHPASRPKEIKNEEVLLRARSLLRELKEQLDELS